jgi:chromosome segregation ATPase
MSSSLLLKRMICSCGPAPGTSGTAQQAGIAAPEQSSAPSSAQLLEQERQKKLQELNQKINQGNAQDEQLTIQLDQLRNQIGSAQAALANTQTSTQQAITQRTDEYTARDIQIQNQQLELEIVRSQLQSQIQVQKATVDGLQNTVQQQQSWGFESPELIDNTAKLTQAQSALNDLQNQYWATQQQSSDLSALQSESRTWSENMDRQRFEQSADQQYQAQVKQLDQLQAQYNSLSDKQSQLRQSLGEIESEYRHGSLQSG